MKIKNFSQKRPDLDGRTVVVVDGLGMLEVGGRLTRAAHSYDAIAIIILLKKPHITRLV